ncbi:MAG: hypothetical protein ACFFD2_14065, partial [Promethearchaeota archaeon]
AASPIRTSCPMQQFCQSLLLKSQEEPTGPDLSELKKTVSNPFNIPQLLSLIFNDIYKILNAYS